MLDFRHVSCENPSRVKVNNGFATIEISIKEDGYVESNVTESFFVRIMIGYEYQDSAVVYIEDTTNYSHPSMDVFALKYHI